MLFLLVGCLNSSEGYANYKDIQKSREESYVNTTLNFIKAVRAKVNEASQFQFYDNSVLYMIPVGNDSEKACVTIDSGGTSPFSNYWRFAYVGVIFDGYRYIFSFVGIDGSDSGFPFMTEEDIGKNGLKNLYIAGEVNDIKFELGVNYNSTSNIVHDITQEEKVAYADIIKDYPIDKVVYLSAKAGCKY